MSWSEIANLLSKIGVPNEAIREMADPLYSMAFGKPTINIGKFDDWLHNKFGNYEDNHQSMEDVIHNNFPKHQKLLEEALGIKEKTNEKKN